MRALVLGYWVLAVIAGLVACTHDSVRRDEAGRRKCAENLHAIALLLRESIPVAPDYPSTLVKLAPFTTNHNLFVCPSTDHRAGSMTNVDEWSDYIYVANLPEVANDANVALLICAPENHGGKYGNVLYLTGEVEELAAPDAKRLVASPWCFATNAPPDETDFLERRTVVIVPKGLKTLYPDSFHPDNRR